MNNDKSLNSILVKNENDALTKTALLQQLHQQEILLSINKHIAAISGRKELFAVIISEVQRIIPVDDTAIVVLNEDGTMWQDWTNVDNYQETEGIKKLHENNVNELLGFLPHHTTMEECFKKTGIHTIDHYIDGGHPFASFMYEYGIKEFLFTPLIFQGKTIGTLYFDSKEYGTYSEKYFDTFRSIANMIASAVANILAREEIIEREREKDILITISQKLSHSTKADELLQIIVNEVKPIFNFYDTGILVIDEAAKGFYDLSVMHPHIDGSEVNNFLNNKDYYKEKQVLKLENSGVEHILRKFDILKNTFVFDYLQDNSSYSDADLLTYLKNSGYVSAWICPLVQQGKTFGILALNYTKNQTIPFEKQTLFEALSDRISSCLSNILANEEILEREREKSRLLEISEAIATVQSNKQLLKVIYEKIKPVFEYDSAGLFIIDKEGKNCYEITDDEVLPDDVQNEITKKKLLGPFPMTEFTKDFWFNYEKPTITTISQQAEYVSDIVGKAQFEIGIAHGLKDFICGPLNCGGKKIGMLCFSVKKENYYTNKDLSLFKSISDLIAVAVANILANEEILEREKEKTRQLEILETLNQSNSWAEKFTTVAHKFDDFIGCDLFSYSIRMNDGRRMGNGFLKEAGTGLFKVNSIEQYVTDMGISETRYQELYHDAMDFFTGSKFFTASTLQEAKKNLQLVKKSMDAYGSQSLMFTEKFFTKGSILFILTSKKDNLYNASSLHFLETTAQQMTLSVMNILDTEEIEKQFIEIKELKNQLEAENVYLQQEVKNIYNFDEIIGQSEVLHEAFEKTNVVALTDASVLLLGETGTGKELFARAIHNASIRQKKPLIKINCAALPPHLIESELFGHERGAFTGAFDKRIGKFELAHESTLFLDEIGELPLDLQGKLLRALQEKEIERLGSNKVIKTDVRIIAATNRDLEAEVAEGRFRADLYFRLNVFPIHLPALRERQDDIDLLVSHFIARFSKKFGKPLKGISTTALQVLKLYPFPGNVRELEHIIERSCILAKTPIVKEVFVPKIKSTTKEDNYIKSHQENEQEHIELVLSKCEGKIFGKAGAAEVLGLPPTTLIGKMKKLGIKK